VPRSRAGRRRVEEIVDGGEKGVGPERFDKEGVGEGRGAGLVVLTKPADGDDLDGGVEALDDAGEGGAVEVGHVEVGDDDADLAGARGEERNAFGAVGGGEDAVAVTGEDRGGHVADARFVVDDEHEVLVAAALGDGDAGGGGGGGGRRDLGGEVDAEGGAFSGGGVKGDEAAVGIDDAADGGEAEAGAFAGVLGGEERFPDPGKDVGRNAGAGVFDLKEEEVAGATTGNFVCGFGREDGVFAAQRESAAVGHGVAGVDGEVEEDLVDLGGVGLDGPEVGGDVVVEGDRFREGFLNERGDVAEEVFDLDDAVAAVGAVGEAEDLADEGGAAFGAFFEGGDEADVVGIRRVVTQHGSGEEHGREDVVEVVGDAGGEHAEAFEALGAEELFLDAAFFGDVGGDDEAALDVADAVAENGDAGVDDDGVSVAMEQVQFAAPVGVGWGAGAGGFDVAEDGFAEQFAERAALGLRGRPPECAGGAGIPEGDAILEVGDGDGVAGFLENVGLVAEPAFGFVVAEADGGDVDGDVDEVDMTRRRRAGLPHVDGERADETVLDIEDRGGPAGVEAVREGGFAVVFPERVPGDVADDDGGAAIGGGATGAGGGSDGGAVDDVDVAPRQARRGGVADLGAGLGDDENRADHLVGLVLDDAEEGVEGFVKRFAAGDHLEDLVLAVEEVFALFPFGEVADEGGEIGDGAVGGSVTDDGLGDGDAIALVIKEDVFTGPAAAGCGGGEVVFFDEVADFGRVEVGEEKGGGVGVGRQTQKAAGGVVEVEHLAVGAGLADEVGGAFEGGGEAFAFGFDGAEFLAFLAFAEGAADGGDEAKRAVFEDVVVGAGAHGVDGAVFADVAGEEDEGCGRDGFAGEAEGVAAVEADEAEIGEDEIVVAAQFAEVAVAGGDGRDLALGPFLDEKLTDELRVGRTVFQVENPHDRWVGAGGPSDGLHG